MKLRNKETGDEVPYVENQTEFNPDIWELVEGEIDEMEFLTKIDEDEME